MHTDTVTLQDIFNNADVRNRFNASTVQVDLWLTATKVTHLNDDDLEPGTIDDPYMIEDGWVDPKYSFTELYPSRNDVSPWESWDIRVRDYFTLEDELSCDETVAEIRSVMECFNVFPSQATEQNGTYYAESEIVWDYEEGTSFLYTCHMTVKTYSFNDTNEWEELRVTL